MKLHEKTLELNITHELLRLTDSWYWFLKDITLWRYWRPRYRLPFIKYPKSTAGGFHITTEGKSDPTGKNGGGYDVRIKAGHGDHLLFIQYKMGTLISGSPSINSIFEKEPQEHFKFKINSTSTNQHFLLQDLAKGIGSTKGNGVVYAFPLIADMKELEENSGKLVLKTKFISVTEIDKIAKNHSKEIESGKEHNFRICKKDFNRCELNYEFIEFTGEDRSAAVLSDIIVTSFQKNLKYFINEIKKGYEKYNLKMDYIATGLQFAFNEYQRYLLHYFEVKPQYIADGSLINKRVTNFYFEDEFEKYQNNERNINILVSVFKNLKPYKEFIEKLETFSEMEDAPTYNPSTFIGSNGGNGFKLLLDEGYLINDIENISYLMV